MFTTRYRILKLPRLAVDMWSDEHNPGAFYVRIPAVDVVSETPPMLRIYSCATDSTRFGRLCCVPRLHVRQNAAPDHYPNSAGSVTVGELVMVIANVGTTPWVPPNPETLRHPLDSDVISGSIVSLTYRSAFLSNAQLRSLGYKIGEYQPRTTIAGQTDAVLRYLSKFYPMGGLLTVTWNQTTEDTTVRKAYSVPGSLTAEVVEGGLTVGQSMLFQSDSFDNAKFTNEYYGLPANYYPIAVGPDRNLVTRLKTVSSGSGTRGKIAENPVRALVVAP